MTEQDHDRWSDSVGAWVLGALPDADRTAFAAHLAQCPACRDEEAELRLAANALPSLVPQVPAPPELRDRIMRVVEAEAELLAAAGPEADRPRRATAEIPTTRRRVRWFAGVAAAAALAVGVLVAVLGGDGVETAPVKTVAGVALEIRGDSARLVGDHLPAPPAGRVYQVWVKRDGKVEPTEALFSVTRDGRASVAVGDVEDVSQVMVTDEPPRGSQRPTGKLLLSAAVPA
jgi:hypothetical protein